MQANASNAVKAYFFISVTINLGSLSSFQGAKIQIKLNTEVQRYQEF
jgi:hypothetical protein